MSRVITRSELESLVIAMAGFTDDESTKLRRAAMKAHNRFVTDGIDSVTLLPEVTIFDYLEKNYVDK